MKQKNYDYQKDMVCKFNPGVVCSVKFVNGEEVRECLGCGWNPAVEASRKAKLNAAQFVRDANAPTTTYIIDGAIVHGSNADPVTLRCSKSPHGNLVVKMGAATIVIPGKTVMDAMGSKQ